MRTRGPDVLVVCFGSNYSTPTLQALESLGATCVVVSAIDLTVDVVRDICPRSIVYSASGLGTDFGVVQPGVLACDVSMLGICNGAQLLGSYLGGTVVKLASREDAVVDYYPSKLPGLLGTKLRREEQRKVVMQHDYVVQDLPSDCVVRGSTALTRVASFDCWRAAPVFGLQFHPEDPRTDCGRNVLQRFLAVGRAYSLYSRWSSPLT